MNFLYFWVAVALVFLIVEFATATFYGLALSLAAAIVGLYVFVSGEAAFTIVQGIIFAVASLVFAYALPKLLSSSDPDMPQGMDRYTGEVRTVKKSGGEYKISLDGVEYVVESDTEISAGDKVSVLGSHGTAMHVKKVN
jgi:membrane protein implicated in regulation of membrane protease activity